MPPTVHTCPKGHHFATRATLHNVTLENNGQNILVTCPQCGATFDAMPTDGTYSTGLDGRLVKVAEYLSRADRDELERLRAQIEVLRRAPNVSDALEIAERVGWRPPNAPENVPLRQVVKESADAANALMAAVLKLGGIITTLVLVAKMSPEEIAELVQRLL